MISYRNVLALLPCRLLIFLSTIRLRGDRAAAILQTGEFFLRRQNVKGALMCFSLLKEMEERGKLFRLGNLLRHSDEAKDLLARQLGSVAEEEVLLSQLLQESPEKELLIQLSSRKDSFRSREALFELFLLLERERMFVEARGFVELLRTGTSGSSSIAYHLARFLRNRGEPLVAKSLLSDAQGKEQQGLLSFIEGEVQILQHELRPVVSPRQLGRMPQGVLHVLEASLPDRKSGYTYRSAQLLAAQRKLGFSPQAVTRAGFGSAPTADYHRLRTDLDENYRRIALDRYLESYVAALSELVGDLTPAILHAHSDYKNGLATLAVGDAFGIPVVYELRGLFEDTQVALSEIEEQSFRYQKTRLVELECCQRASAVVVLGEAMRLELIERGIAEEKIFSIPNGAVGGEAPSKKRDLGEPFTVGYIGTLNVYEGLETLFEAVASLLNTGHFLKVRIVGDGPHRKSLQQRAAALGLQKVVCFTGAIAHNDISAEYKKLNLFCLPRRDLRVCRLVTPLKPFEALGYRIPVLAARHPAVELELGAHISYFHPDDAVSLKEALEQHLKESPEAIHLRTEQAYRWLIQERSWEKLCSRYQEVYEYAAQAKGMAIAPSSESLPAPDSVQ